METPTSPKRETSNHSNRSVRTTGTKLSNMLAFRKKRMKSLQLFRTSQELKETSDVPAVGGVEVEEAHLEAIPLMPAYVALFEPRPEDIWIKPKQLRAIFLNQPLLPWEQDAVTGFKALVLADLGLPADAEVPRWLRPHMTRVLQQAKYKPEGALKVYRTLFLERVTKLPIKYADIATDMATGVVYWHGRDVKARPIMVISAARAINFVGRADALQTLFLFHMEFALRYFIVPGRVECWSILIDLAGAENLPVWKCKDMALVLGGVLGKVYSGRMIWIRLFNFPNTFMGRAMRAVMDATVSALGKADKVSFIKDCDLKSWYSGLLAPGQLEQRFGGTAPNVPAAQVFPYRMFGTPEGYIGNDGEKKQEASLHTLIHTTFCEGVLWADCLDNQETSWRQLTKTFPLPPGAAEEVGAVPCRKLDDWTSIMQKRGENVKEALDEEMQLATVDRGQEAGSSPEACPKNKTRRVIHL